MSARGRDIRSAVWAEHRLLVTLAVTYIGSGGLLLMVLGRAWPLQLTTAPFMLSWLVISGLGLVFRRLRVPRPLRATLGPERVAGALLVAVMVMPTQITFQALKQAMAPVIGFRLDAHLHGVDVTLHGRMPWQWFGWLLTHPALVRGLDLLYMLWFLLLLCFAAWASWTSRRQLRTRALIAFLLLWVLGGTVGAGLGASAGPCYYDKVVAGANPYAGLMARLDAIDSAGAPLAARLNQRALWDLSERAQWAPFGGISAMPSLHVGISALLAIIAWGRYRRVAYLLWIYAALIQIGSVVLGWHYAVDGYVGGGFAALSWILAGRLVQRGDAPVAVRAPAAPTSTTSDGHHAD